MPWPARAALAAVACFGLGVLAAAGQVTQGLFSASTSNPGSSFSAAPDLTAPSASPAVVGKSSGGATGYISRAAPTTSTRT